MKVIVGELGSSGESVMTILRNIVQVRDDGWSVVCYGTMIMFDLG